MRTFIAVELPELFKDEVVGVVRQLSAVIDARYVPRENYHITLAFLGEISEVEVGNVIEIMNEVTAEMKGFSLRSDGIGKFGRAQNATLWLGIEKVPELMELDKSLREKLAGEGIGVDEKAFLPHITLARHAVIPNIELPQLLFPQDDIARKITLFKSTLLKSGAEYKPLYAIEW